MARRLSFQGLQIAFPNVCVVCQAPCEKDYQLTRVITYGNRTITVKLPVPMCAAHYQMATSKNAREKAVERAGWIVGGVLGVIAAAALLIYWSQSGQGALALNILLATVIGIGVLLIAWVIAATSIAPGFADPDAKIARNAVKIHLYNPSRDQLQLNFANDRAAQWVAEVNGERVLKNEQIR